MAKYFGILRCCVGFVSNYMFWNYVFRLGSWLLNGDSTASWGCVSCFRYRRPCSKYRAVVPVGMWRGRENIPIGDNGDGVGGTCTEMCETGCWKVPTSRWKFVHAARWNGNLLRCLILLNILGWWQQKEDSVLNYSLELSASRGLRPSQVLVPEWDKCRLYHAQNLWVIYDTSA